MWIFAVIGIIIVLVIITGSFIPKNHIASGSRNFRSSPEKIYAVLTDEPSQPAWRSDLKAIERSSGIDGRELWIETWKNGQKMYLETEAKIPPVKIIRRIINNKMFGGTWSFDITPEHDGTRVTITENGEIFNPVFRLLGKLFYKPDTTLRKYLDDLGKVVE